MSDTRALGSSGTHIIVNNSYTHHERERKDLRTRPNSPPSRGDNRSRPPTPPYIATLPGGTTSGETEESAAEDRVPARKTNSHVASPDSAAGRVQNATNGQYHRSPSNGSPARPTNGSPASRRPSPRGSEETSTGAGRSKGATMDVDADGDADEEPEFDVSDDEPEEARFPISHELLLKDHTKVVSALTMDPSGARVLSGSHDYDCKLWDFGGMDWRCKPFKTWEPAGSYYVRITSSSLGSNGKLMNVPWP